LVEAKCAEYGLPLWYGLGMLMAESGLNAEAERWGVWPDVSFGLGQMTVQTAEGYGIGNGQDTPANRAYVRDVLLDRETNVDVCFRHLAGCLETAKAWGYEGEEMYLQGLIAYNSGSPKPEGNWWWEKWGHNVETYRAGLAWSRETLATQGKE
jgi:hypothetical protein